MLTAGESANQSLHHVANEHPDRLETDLISASLKHSNTLGLLTKSYIGETGMTKIFQQARQEQSAVFSQIHLSVNLSSTFSCPFTFTTEINGTQTKKNQVARY